MSKSVIALAAVSVAFASAAAFAQSAPARGIGLLALGATELPSGLGTAAPGGARSSLVDVPDSGGGSHGAVRAAPAVPEPAAAATPDALPLKPLAVDPAAPAAPTPKRPSYRWQSLVPGAIK
ncbi:MAG TPA: hypothetical protein VGC30_07045 [Dokdonella sp.]